MKGSENEYWDSQWGCYRKREPKRVAEVHVRSFGIAYNALVTRTDGVQSGIVGGPQIVQAENIPDWLQKRLTSLVKKYHRTRMNRQWAAEFEAEEKRRSDAN